MPVELQNFADHGVFDAHGLGHQEKILGKLAAVLGPSLEDPPVDASTEYSAFNLVIARQMAVLDLLKIPHNLQLQGKVILPLLFLLTICLQQAARCIVPACSKMFVSASSMRDHVRSKHADWAEQNGSDKEKEKKEEEKKGPEPKKAKIGKKRARETEEKEMEKAKEEEEEKEPNPKKAKV